MADRVDILRRLDARIEEAGQLWRELDDLRDEFRPGADQRFALGEAQSLFAQGILRIERLRDGMRIG